jgi:hypothetical protein
MLTATKPKACRVCAVDFVPVRSMQTVCTYRCARRVPVLRRKAEREERKADRAKLDAMKPLGHWKAQAQQAFNAWIRQRDEHEPCISCGRFHQGKWNAGHYLSTGARPELRFEPLNVHKQCEPCNTNLSGNLIRYRANLLKRIGPLLLIWLEGPHPPNQYRADDLKAIRDDYRGRLKAMKERA